jgi:hypothetical protein
MARVCRKPLGPHAGAGVASVPYQGNKILRDLVHFIGREPAAAAWWRRRSAVGAA